MPELGKRGTPEMGSPCCNVLSFLGSGTTQWETAKVFQLTEGSQQGPAGAPGQQLDRREENFRTKC